MALGTVALLIADSDDRIVSSLQQSASFSDQLPHGEVLLIDDTGHMVHHSATDRVASAIRRVADAAQARRPIPRWPTDVPGLATPRPAARPASGLE
jgi:hypothetical protein